MFSLRRYFPCWSFRSIKAKCNKGEDSLLWIIYGDGPGGHCSTRRRAIQEGEVQRHHCGYVWTTSTGGGIIQGNG